MGIRYSESLKDFTTLGCLSANIIPEQEYGHRQNGFLIYPNVNSCTTITVMLDDDEVFGTHLTYATEADLAERLLKKINDSRGARNVAQLSVVGVVDAPATGWRCSAKYSGQNLYRTLNETFGRPKTAPVFLCKQEYKQNADYFHYKVTCGRGALGWYFATSRELNAKITEFKPIPYRTKVLTLEFQAV